jgi:hypothetical protein
VATYSTGITATWGSVTFGEMQSLSWTHGGSGSKGRGAPWTDELGTVSIQCLGATGISTANAGQRNQLTITGGGCTLTTYAIWESLSVDAELNGVTRYSVSLKILDQ